MSTLPHHKRVYILAVIFFNPFLVWEEVLTIQYIWLNTRKVQNNLEEFCVL